ncbi:MAG TPA: hypothetical protein VFW38_13580 [Solirubrobacteraceae bacterium]|nr:hypothetical protein [Solirubrobacteraceae bacterium]
MTLLKREPRSVYRVYADDEYLDSEQPETTADSQSPAPEFEPTSNPAAQKRQRPAVALLVGALIVMVMLAAVAIVIDVGHGTRGRARPAVAAGPARQGMSKRRQPRRLRPYRRPVRAKQQKQPKQADLDRKARQQPASAPVPAPPVVFAVPRLRLAPDAQVEFGFER